MGSLRRRSASWGPAKPRVGTLVDSGHQLAQGLSTCFFFNELAGTTCFDVVGQNELALPNDTPEIVWDATGLNATGNATSGQANGCLETIPFTGVTGSVAARIAVYGSTTSSGWNIMLDSTDSAGIWMLKTATLGIRARYDDLVGTWHSNTALAAGVFHDIVWSLTNGNLTFFVDGKQDGTQSGVGSYSGFGTFALYDGTSYVAYKIAYLMVWPNRALTLSDAQELRVNPYAVAQKPRRRKSVRASSVITTFPPLLPFPGPQVVVN